MQWKMSDKRLFQNQSQNVFIEALSVLFYAHYMAVGIEMVLSIKKMLTQVFTELGWGRVCDWNIQKNYYSSFSLYIL